ncbi:MAG: DUF1993 domain-containing protein [Gammaproteobacteria bacterium]
MKISMYQASVPVFVRMLDNLSNILEQAVQHTEEKKIDPAVLINARLAPDMYPLARQVQIATDMAKGCAARLAGLEVPVYDDDETTFPELLARIAKTIAFVQSVSPAKIDGSEEKTVTLKLSSQKFTFLGLPYLLNFVLPNFYFHITTAYAILRHYGLPLGKKDFVGSL